MRLRPSPTIFKAAPSRPLQQSRQNVRVVLAPDQVGPQRQGAQLARQMGCQHVLLGQRLGMRVVT